MASEESITRPHVMTVRMSDEEKEFHDELARREGIGKADAFRKGMLDYGRSVGLEFPLKRKAPISPIKKR